MLFLFTSRQRATGYTTAMMECMASLDVTVTRQRRVEIMMGL